jgi:hypothetical protein
VTTGSDATKPANIDTNTEDLSTKGKAKAETAKPANENEVCKVPEILDTCGIERHQQDAVKGKLCRVNQTRNLFLAEYLRKVQNLLRIRRLGNTPASLQHLNIKEA